ncbi:MAG: hypothetical protein PHG24_01285 [Candidatus Pacebacteria bacterium]|nr:hypothetical protein [Candidatus Paceibacterota bacterium]
MLFDLIVPSTSLIIIALMIIVSLAVVYFFSIRWKKIFKVIDSLENEELKENKRVYIIMSLFIILSLVFTFSIGIVNFNEERQIVIPFEYRMNSSDLIQNNFTIANFTGIKINSEDEFKKAAGNNPIYYNIETLNNSENYPFVSVVKKYISFIPGSKGYLFYDDVKEIDLFYQIDDVNENRIILKGIDVFYCSIKTVILLLFVLLSWTVLLLFMKQRPIIKKK